MSDIRFNRWSHSTGTGGIFQDSSGRVGIGSSVPKTTLDVVGIVSATGAVISGVSTFSSDITISNGNIVIGTSGKGIDFSANANAAGMTSELLDDYEEGTFTVTPNTNLTLNSSYTTWFYTKIGRQVTISGLFIVSSVSGTNGVTGSLPFVSATSPANGTGSYAGGTMSHGIDIGDAGMAWYIAGEGSNIFTFYRIFDNGGWDQLPNSALAPNDQIYATMTYFTSS